MTSPGDAAAHLTWLVPRASSLVALARLDAGSWARLRCDPAAVLMLARFAPGFAEPASFSPTMLRAPSILQAALRHFDQPAMLDDRHLAVQSIHRLALACAERAAQLAKRTGKADPEFAWIGGLLAPLGWLAVSATDPDAVARCLADPGYPGDPSGTQRSHWGLDGAGIARRLARRWQMPHWLAALVGHLSLPTDTAVALGAEPALFPIVRLAVALAHQDNAGQRIEVGSPVRSLAQAVGLSDDELQAIISEQGPTDPAATEPNHHAEHPASVPLLRDLLMLAEENRRLSELPILHQLESDLDEMHRAYAEQRASEESRLRTQKLSTLAEFAAGAGHEINNPLAVISGQAQYLLGHESDAGRQHSLHKIVGQTQRIHELLNQLMQFARPSRPQRQLIDLLSLVRNTTLGLADFAQERRVRLTGPTPDEPLNGFVDPKQLHLALTALVRNGIEAAPPDGWVDVHIEAGSQTVDVIVEDSGPGPTDRQREHIFDPFYSGRQAGRGRGLGLPAAWRLAREHGGDVFLDERTNGRTRFVLRLPRDISWNEALANGCSIPARNGFPISRETRAAS